MARPPKQIPVSGKEPNYSPDWIRWKLLKIEDKQKEILDLLKALTDSVEDIKCN